MVYRFIGLDCTDRLINGCLYLGPRCALYTYFRYQFQLDKVPNRYAKRNAYGSALRMAAWPHDKVLKYLIYKTAFFYKL